MSMVPVNKPSVVAQSMEQPDKLQSALHSPDNIAAGSLAIGLSLLMAAQAGWLMIGLAIPLFFLIRPAIIGLRRGRNWVLAIPYLWLLIFFLAPFLIVLKISFAEMAEAIPPYTSIIEVVDQSFRINLNLGNYHQRVFNTEDDLYAYSYINSMRIAAISTLIALFIAYPMAYAIAKAPPERRNILLMLVILPFWTSFLIRVYAWISIIEDGGALNSLLIAIGLIEEPLIILNTDLAVYIGLVYCYLPFMILPLYATLERLDGTLLEAAMDLGCKPFSAFLAITLPLSMPGVIAGSMLMFIPAVGEVVIPALLGGPDTLMIGRVLWDEYFSSRDWPSASAVAVAIMVLLVVPIILFQRYQARETGQ